MTDSDDLERVLRRYRPAGPDAALRARVLGRRNRRRVPAFWWSVAAALLVALVLHVMASRTYERIGHRASEEHQSDREARLDAMMSALGSPILSRDVVWRAVLDEEQRVGQRAIEGAPMVMEGAWTQ